jgi:hypothetical protein
MAEIAEWVMRVLALGILGACGFGCWVCVKILEEEKEARRKLEEGKH